MTFDEFCTDLVLRYLAGKDCCCSESAIKNYYGNLTIEEAVKEATNYGRYEIQGKESFDEHYQNFPKPSLEQARDHLLRLAPKLRDCRRKDFLSVYRLVRGCTEGIVPDVGRLFWYDTSLRIASSYEINKQPEHVFIHRGTQWGAEALGVDLHNVTYENPYLPKAHFVRVSASFDRLNPDQIESMLCIYHNEIASFFERPVH
jgi:hypothetical protein